MKKAILFSMLVCMVGLFITSGVYAVPPEVKQQMVKTNVIIITEENKDVVWDLRPDQHPDRADYVILKLEFSKLESDMVDILREWVRSGKGAIVSTSNVHPTERIFFSKEELTSKQHQGGEIVVSSSPGAHPITHAVKKATFQRQRLGCPYTLERQRTMKFVPVLESSEGKIWAAAAKYGEGRVVVFASSIYYAPILQNTDCLNKYDNERFAINLDQWLAGYPVPGVHGHSAAITGSEEHRKVSKKKFDSMYMKNGDVISGDVLTETFKLKTSYGELEFKATDIRSIKFEGGGGNNVDVIILKVGDKLSGVMQNDKVLVKLSSGVEITLEKDKMKEIIFKG